MKLIEKVYKSKFWWLIKWIILIISNLLILFFSAYFDFFTDIFITICTSIFLLLLTYDLMTLLTKIIHFMENRRFSKQPNKYNKLTLFRWSEGIEDEERLFYRILNDEISADPIENLNLIKKRIINVCSGNIEKLKLLKAYVERSMHYNIIDKFRGIFLGGLIALGTGLFTNLASNDKFINIVHNFITGNDKGIQNIHIPDMINYVTYLLIFILFLMYTWERLTTSKRRLFLLDKIIDQSISEIEMKKNENK